jgi:hypothetical protein
MRFLGLMVVLVVAASIAAASAQTQTTGNGHDGKPSAGLELTYTKWVAPYPTLVGFVGGDIVGKFSGGILERTVDPTGRYVHLTAIYIVIGPDPAHSFTAHVEGTEDLQTLHAVLDGRVVDGLLKHGDVHVEFNVISNCTQSPNGTCFQGTISVRQGASSHH